jgi:hypothetical protein
MFGIFKYKLKAKDIIISNIGFHAVFNHCRDTFDHRLHDDYSSAVYKSILYSIKEAISNGVDDEELFTIILDGFEYISPNGSPRLQFEQVAQQFANATNKLKGSKFIESKNTIKQSRFDLDNIEETIRKGKENGTW